MALGILAISVPLLALSAGYGAAQIGLLVAFGAATQLIARSFMGALMRALPEKFLIMAAGALIACACGLLIASSGLAFFGVSQALFGVSRAFFWTATQTHVVRVADSSVRGLTVVALAGGTGMFLGPVLAGVIADHFGLAPALGAGVLFGAASTIAACLLDRLPPFHRIDRPGQRGIWRRPGVGAGCWMGVGAGVWKSLLDSYVPIVLSLAGQTAGIIGALLAVGNGASLVGSGLAGPIRRMGIRGSMLIGLAATGIGLGAMGPFAGTVFVAALALFVSGTGAGILQTVGPAIATDSVHEQERGDAIAAVGLVRAAALFVAPLGMAALVGVAPIGVAVAIAGGVVLLPAVFTRWLAAGN